MADLQDMKILIIDDDSTSVTLMKTILEGNGYTNIVFTLDAKEGLELVTTACPDLIVLDIVMPEIDGYEFCRRLHKDEKNRNIPVIMVTGGAIEIDEALWKTFEVGAMDFIAKPIRSMEFLVRIKSALKMRQAHDHT